MQPRVFNDDLIPGIVIYVSDIDPQDGRVAQRVHGRQPGAARSRRWWWRAGGRLRHRPRAEEGRDRARRRAPTYTFSAVDARRLRPAGLPAAQLAAALRAVLPGDPAGQGRPRDDARPSSSGRSPSCASQGKGPTEWYRYDVEYHKKFAIAGACIVFGLLGLGLSLGSKKEARSAAFGLSMAVIFVYYVLIRLGEQAGDTGMLRPWLAMWGANIVLGLIAVLLLALNQREAAFDPLDPRTTRRCCPASGGAGRLAVAPARARRARRGPAGPGGPRKVVVLRIPRWVAAAARPARPLHRALLPGQVRRWWSIAFWALFVLVSFMDLFDDVQQNKVKGIVVHALLRVLQPADPAPDHAGGGAGLRAHHVRHPGAAQRDHGHEGGRHQHLPGHAARDRPGPRWSRSACSAWPSTCCRRMNKVAEPRLQRDQGPPAPGLDHQRAALDPRQRRPHLPLRLPGARRRGGRIALRPTIYDVTTAALGAARHPLRRARHLERRVLRPGARLAAHLRARSRRSATIAQAPHARDRAAQLLRAGAAAGRHAPLRRAAAAHRVAWSCWASTSPRCGCSSTASSPSRSSAW